MYIYNGMQSCKIFDNENFMKKGIFPYIIILSFSLVSLSQISCNNKKQSTPELAQQIVADDTSNKKGQNSNNSSAKIQIDTARPFAISAADLIKNYSTNEVKADIDYKEKVLVVTGIVKEIKKGITGNIYVILLGSEKTRFVFCYFNNEDKAAALTPGMELSFKGKCEGLLGDAIILKDCEVAYLD